jgi:CHAT domain-containing protein
MAAERALRDWLAGLARPADPAAGLDAIAAAIDRGALDRLVAPETLAAWADRLAAAPDTGELDTPDAPGWLCWALARQASRQLPDRQLRRMPAVERAPLLVTRARLTHLAARRLARAGQPARAAASARQAAGDAYAAGATALAGHGTLDEAGCLLALGRAGDALSRYQTAARLLATAGDQAGQAAAWLGQAAALRALGRAAEALPCYTAAETLLAAAPPADPADAARGLANHASCLADLGRPADALPRFAAAAARLAALDLAAEHAACLMNWASCLHDAGDITQAHARYREALRRCEALGPAGEPVRWRVLYNLAALCRQTGDWTRARALLETAMPLIERVAAGGVSVEDRLSLRETAADVYRLAVATALALAEAEPAQRERHVQRAFDDAQRAKGRLVAELLAGRAAPAAAPADVAAIQACLAPDELLLDCLALAGELAIFGLRATGGLTVHTVPQPAVAAAVAELEEALLLTQRVAGQGGVPPSRPSPALARLYDLLIAPLAEQGLLAGVRHLIIAPSAPLHRAPLAALWRPVDGVPRYLCQDYGLSTVPTAATLRLLRDRPAAPLAGLLAVAPFCTGTAGERAALPASAREVRAIAEHARRAAPAATVIALEGPAATVGATLARAPRASVIVAATHGLAPAADGGLFDFSLAFAPERPGAPPGQLRLRDILDGALPLDGVQQVTLTACSLGQVVQRGEELVGFLQALLGAGARCCLAPLWAVHDEATACFSIAYHAALLAGQPAVAAHGAAMAAVRATPGWGNPFFWAGMLLAGDAAGGLRLPAAPSQPPSSRLMPAICSSA